MIRRLLTCSTLLYRFSIVFLSLAAMPLMGQVPYQVKVINPTYSASIRDAVGMNGVGYFVAGSYLNFSTGQWDEELWRTDGTEAGTYRVKDIRAGQVGSNIKWMTVVGNTLYFSANDGTSGDELWKSDGTEPGTVRVVELSVGSGGGNLQSLVDYNGVLHFIGTYANGSTYLFRSDGTAAGTVPVSTAVTPYAPTSIYPDRRLTVWNGHLWFMGASLPSFTPSGLYRSDGTSAGTTLIKVLDSPGSDMVAATSQLFFTANDATFRRELWRSDGTAAGTYMTKDLNPINSGFNGSSSAWIYWTVGDVCIFSGVDGNPTGNRKLYRSDGTAGGTHLLVDIYPGASDVTNGSRTNAGRTYMVWESRQQGGSSAPHLYVTDGTVAGTVRLKTFLSFCQNFTAMDGVMYFRANDGSAAGGTELWRTNGTVAGTYRYADINPGPNGSDPYPVGFFGNLGLLHAGPSYPQLWAFRLCNSAPQPAVSFTPSAVCAGNGAGTATVTNSASFTSFSWTIVNGAFDSPANGSSVSFHATSSSNVQLTVTATADGCQQQASVSIPTVSAPATITASGPTTFCEGGSVTLTAPSGMASYLWSNGATTQSIIVNAGGNYTVTVTNGSGCSATSSATAVTVHPAPATPVITTSGPTTFCEGGGVTLTAPAGMSSYAWSNGATTQSILVIESGNYNVSVTNANGCSATSAATTVTVNPLPEGVITPSGPTTFCEGGSVTLTAPAGMASYVWSNGGTTQSITVNASGNYDVTFTNANGCSSTVGVPVQVNPAPTATITANGPTTFCEGGSVTLTAPAGMAAYAWSNGATTQSITVSAAGDYSVTVTNADGCSASSSSTSVTVNPLPEPTISASGPTTFCEGGSVTLTAPAGMASYVWSNGATTESITVSAAGSYGVTVTNANGCSTSSSPTSVTVSSVPTGLLGVVNTVCENVSNTASVQAILDGAYVENVTYAWSMTNGTITQINGKHITFVSSTPGQATITVVITAANGCESAPIARTIEVMSPTIPTITASGPTTFCEGNSVTLTSSLAGSYLWSTGETTQSILVTASGNHTVTTSDSFNCGGTSAPVTVTVHPEATVPAITASGPTTFCEGGSVTLTAPAGYTYLWSNGATTQSIVVNASGSYSVTTTNANGCSATSSATTATVNSAPATPAITASGPTTFCEGGSVTLSAPAGYTYLWSNGATTQSIVVNASGSYSVTTTNANGCSATSSATIVTVNPLPAVPAITAGGPTALCPGSSVTLTAPAGYAYLWSNGATTQAITISAAGSYWVRVTNAQGCSRDSAPVTVTANAPTQITTHPASATIARNTTRVLSVIATGTAPLQYQWFTGTTGDTSKPVSGATSSSYTAGPFNKKGTYHYWVRVTSGTCTGSVANSNTATITVN